MTKTLYLYGILVGVILGLSIAIAQEAKPEFKCYSNKDFMKYIDDNHLVTVYGGETTTEKTQELMISNDRKAYTVEYVRPKEGATAADKYCVVSVTHDVTFNDSAIEFLYNLLEKVRGKKV